MSFFPTTPLANIIARAELLKRVRRFFDEKGFYEVCTPILSADTLVDVHVEPFSLCDATLPMPNNTGYLQTSPEFAMKRLLLSGVAAIYQIAHAFRKSDRGDWHNVEFSMLEYYRIGDGYNEGILLLAEFIETVLNCQKTIKMPFTEPFFAETHICPHSAICPEFLAFAQSKSIEFPKSYVNGSKDDWIDLIFSECVQPKLGFSHPVILYDFPCGLPQLAKTRETPVGAVTERFELYVKGVELANGYNELLDSDVLLKRIRRTNKKRIQIGKEPFREESRLLSAMEHGIPPCSGTALGLDRLLMILVGSEQISDVIPFPIEIGRAHV